MCKTYYENENNTLHNNINKNRDIITYKEYYIK